jgi:hypothetical protein
VEQPIAATNSSQRGLCHGKKSELESLAEQQIAATNSPQYNLPAGLVLRSANSFNLPAGLDLRSANSILSAGLGLRSARSINFPAGLGLRSANSSNLSTGLGLRAASWNSNETFKLVVASVKNKYSKVQASQIFLPQTTIQFHHSRLLLSQLLREHLKSFLGHLAS